MQSLRTQHLKERRSEDTIRSRLREIIEQSRRVRAELSEMIGEEGQSSRFLHRASWPTQPALPNAEDRPPKKKRKAPEKPRSS